jgi:hypothetical protein
MTDEYLETIECPEPLASVSKPFWGGNFEPTVATVKDDSVVDKVKATVKAELTGWVIPRTNQYTFKKGDKGIGVWSLQKALNDIGLYNLVADGDFGTATDTALKHYQTRYKVAGGADGLAGPGTQRSLIANVVDRRDSVTTLPHKLLYGFAEREGGWLLAPVNWSVAGGVDCGAFQRRVFDEDYGDTATIERAFNTTYQCRLLADRLTELRGLLITRAGVTDGYNGLTANEKAWRLAALNHNYPSGTDILSKTPIKSLSSYWTSAQSWVTVHNYKFPDGTAVKTPLQWCHLYAGVLGNGVYGHSGNVTTYVTDWTP